MSDLEARYLATRMQEHDLAVSQAGAQAVGGGPMPEDIQETPERLQQVMDLLNAPGPFETWLASSIPGLVESSDLLGRVLIKTLDVALNLSDLPFKAITGLTKKALDQIPPPTDPLDRKTFEEIKEGIGLVAAITAGLAPFPTAKGGGVRAGAEAARAIPDIGTRLTRFVKDLPTGSVVQPTDIAGVRKSMHGRRLRDDPEAVRRVYTYREGTQPEPPVVAASKFKLTLEGPPERQIYNLGQDPLNLRSPDLNEIERRVVQSGFSAFHNPESALPGVVGVTKPMKILRAERILRSEADLIPMLAQDEYVIVSANKPYRTAEETIQARAALAEDIQARGYTAHPGQSVFEGTKEQPFLVQGMSEAEGLELAVKFDQDSILTKRGIVGRDGDVLPLDWGRISINGPEIDNFTIFDIGGQSVKFHVPLKEMPRGN